MIVYSVDRIVGEYAVLVGESAQDISVPLSELPQGIREGNVLRYDGNSYTLDDAEEQRRRAQILSLQNKLRCKKQ